MSTLRFTAALALLLPCCLRAQETPVDTAMMQKIRTEAFAHSQIPFIAHYMTDVAGPRLTNSPGYLHAARWIVQTLRQWGIQKAGLEPWGEFGKGWRSTMSYVAQKTPYYQPLIAYPHAWTAGTGGLVTGPVVMLDTLSEAAIDQMGDAIKGKIVMVRPRPRDTVLASAFTPFATRYADTTTFSELPDMYMIEPGGVAKYAGIFKSRNETRQYLADKGAIALLNPSRPRGRDGTVFVAGGVYYAKGYTPPLPEIALSTEDMLRIYRLLRSAQEVTLEMNIQNQWDSTDTQGYNVIGEIPGTDKKLKSELVMLGGHLDSWHSGTGATDDAAGCIVMMEAMRILKVLGVQPKRSIRMALWGGEEQGLLGSFGYVKKHFGNPADMQLLPEQKKVSAYYNLDNGSGRIRGIYLQNNEAVGPVFRNWLQPFADLGATGVTISNTGATDHLPFDAVGIPGFQFIQDPLEYNTRTHHSNMDTYDHLEMEDLKQAAAIVAAFVYNTAMRDEMLPRKPLPKAARFVFDVDFPL
ncbi:M28 family metallopeptidase [Chitinophaga japonensis]|uniref:Carboxypeptidase Q n=1 Tax=Chitinophaga japonensis TaxID=104662 RepID=A0A562T6Z5_CHIJA|nr:M20/M25/M40 family metallo-hydrolase [Chitinophaga japonensis]TWI89317.1 peptidase M28-like protein [Chitinophaga japonensis]